MLLKSALTRLIDFLKAMRHRELHSRRLAVEAAIAAGQVEPSEIEQTLA
ncbi:MAG: hypothetical protein ABI564_03065 [Ideonella sp.]